MSKRKGSNAERELVRMFWATGEWAASRVAGSGSSRFPSPDLLAGNGKRKLAIECKSTMDEKKYIAKEQVEALRLFAKRFGAEAWIGLRCDATQWFFISLDELEEKEKEFMVSVEIGKNKGLTFNELIGRI